MTNHTTIDGDRFFEYYPNGKSSVILYLKRYSSEHRGGILVFGGVGTLGTISFDDKIHSITTQYHVATGLQLNCRTIADDGAYIQVEVSGLNAWTWYTFIGCNCWFQM